MARTRTDRLPLVMDPRFARDGFEPAYMAVYRRGELAARAQAALAELAECRACPRNCGIDRLADQTRVCNTGRRAIVSSAFAHFGEEDCLRGWRGSGTIFIGLCGDEVAAARDAGLWRIDERADRIALRMR
jgi:putative pyruvate formate lyase activating enzyme